MHAALSAKMSQINRTDEASKTHTCYMCTQAHKNRANRDFFLPACADIQKCQLRRINYTYTVTRRPLRNVQIKTKSLHR